MRSSYCSVGQKQFTRSASHAAPPCRSRTAAAAPRSASVALDRVIHCRGICCRGIPPWHSLPWQRHVAPAWHSVVAFRRVVHCRGSTAQRRRGILPWHSRKASVVAAVPFHWQFGCRAKVPLCFPHCLLPTSRTWLPGCASGAGTSYALLCSAVQEVLAAFRKVVIALVLGTDMKQVCWPIVCGGGTVEDGLWARTVSWLVFC